MPPHDARPAAAVTIDTAVEMATETTVETTARPRLLDPDVRFARLPRPGYDPDAAGIRAGSAVMLSVVGGALVAVSPFGAWLRVTRVAFEEARPGLIHQTLGLDLGLGVWIAVLGVAALVASRAWHRGGRLLRQAAHLVVLAAAVVTGIALLLLQAEINEATARAIEQAGFFNLTVGVGWGAWAALTGAAALVLASVCAAFTAPVEGKPTSHDGRS